MVSKVPILSMEDLSTYYTPGVAYACQAIFKEKGLVYDYTAKSNTIAIVTDGTRILGLGDIGPQAGLPVMEGKAVLFKKYGGVDAVPLCIGTKDEEEIVKFLVNIAPTFGGINIEDIKSPKCFRIVERASALLDIPVLHDDMHGTGIVVLAALLNALKVAGKDKSAKIVINGAGAAGYGIITLLSYYGFRNTLMLDTNGIIHKGRGETNEFKEKVAEMTNSNNIHGDLKTAVEEADVLIGVSSKGAFSKELISKMNDKAIVFALANPYPEIEYNEAKEAGAFIVATGRSDTPNQVNNILAFPGVMRGLLDSRAKKLTYEMLKRASLAIAKSVGKKLSQEYIVPSVLDKSFSTKVAPTVAAFVAEAAADTENARTKVDYNSVKRHSIDLIKRYAKMEKKMFK